MWTTRTTIVIFIAYLLLAVAARKDYLDRPHGGSDDIQWQFELILGRSGAFGEGYENIFSYCMRVLGADSLVGHYAPVRGLIWVAIHGVFGDEQFMLGVVLVGFLMHAATGALLAKALDRISGARTAALVAGAIFTAHPIHDLPLSGANEGMNIYGLFFSLLAILAFDDTRAGRRLSKLAVFASAWHLFCAMNSNAVFLAVTPLLVVFWAVARRVFSDDVPIKRWIVETTVRALPMIVAVSATLLLRFTMNGTVGSRFQETVEWKESNVGFFGTMLRHFVFLDAGTDVLAKGELWYEPTARFPATTLHYVAAAFGILAAIFAVLRYGRSGPPSSARAPRALSPIVLIVIGFLFFIATSGVYFAVRGAVWHHRYYDVGVLGFAPLFAGILALLVDRRSPSRVSLAATGVALFSVLAVYAHFGIAAQRSNREAGEIVRTTATVMADTMRAEPSIDIFFVLDMPKGIGRAGLVFRRDEPLFCGGRLLDFLRTRDEKTALAALPRAGHEDTFLTEWRKLESIGLIQQRIAVFAFDRGTGAIRRVLAVANPLGEVRDILLFPVTSPDGKSTVPTIAQATLDCVDRPWRDEPVTPAALARWSINDPETAVLAMQRLKRLDPGIERTLVDIVTHPFEKTSSAARSALARLWASKAAKRVVELATELDPISVEAARRFATAKWTAGSNEPNERFVEFIRENRAATKYLVRAKGEYDAARAERDLDPGEREMARWLAADTPRDEETIAGLTMLVRSGTADLRDRVAAFRRLAVLDDRASSAAIDPCIAAGLDRVIARATIECASADFPLTSRRALLAVLLRPDFPQTILDAAEARWKEIFPEESLAEVAPLHLALSRTVDAFRNDSPGIVADLSAAVFDQGTNPSRVPEIAELRALVADAVRGKLPVLANVDFAPELTPVSTRAETRWVFASIRNDSAEPIAIGLGRNGFSIFVELVGKTLPNGAVESPPSPIAFTMIPPRAKRVVPIEFPMLPSVESVRLTLVAPRGSVADGKAREVAVPKTR